jgi:hypothetical protein
MCEEFPLKYTVLLKYLGLLNELSILGAGLQLRFDLALLALLLLLSDFVMLF